MTTTQRSEVWRITAILTLTFWLPESNVKSSLNKATLTDNLPLEERLALAPHIQHVCTNGTLMEGRLLVGWQDFMEQAVFGALIARTNTDEQVDLWHLLALAITPRVNRSELNLLPQYRQHPDHYPAVQQLYRLAQCPTAAYFYLQDEQRKYMVQWLYQYWNDPCFHQMAEERSLPWHCAMVHLRACLGAWARRQYGTSPVTHVLARLEDSWPQAWNNALSQLVNEDKIDYESADRKNEDVNSSTCWTRQGLSLYWERGQPRPLPPTGCPHIQRGYILATLLLESCGRDEHEAHTKVALNSMNEVLEWQLDQWTTDDEKVVAPVSNLATVILATTSFLFQLIDAASTREQHAEAYDNIIHCCIQFLRHPNASIRFGATKVLEHAWNILALPTASFASVMLTTFRQIKSTEQKYEWKRILGILSHCSLPFANEIYHQAIRDEGQELHEFVAVIASNQPSIFQPTSHLTTFVRNAADSKDTAAVLSFVAATLATRQAYYFETGFTSLDRLAEYVDDVDPWNQYRMALFALTIGEYDFATHLFDQMSPTVSDEKMYLWTEALTKVARAEGILSKEAALGIPSAGVCLHDALAYLDGLQSRYDDFDFSFQIRLLLLRLDILDLVTVLRQILREVRLTAALPAKGTRPFLHVPSLFRGFLKLAKQFVELDQRFGLLWQSRRTSACLASLRDLAFFLAETTRAGFGSVFPVNLSKVAEFPFAGTEPACDSTISQNRRYGYKDNVHSSAASAGRSSHGTRSLASRFLCTSSRCRTTMERATRPRRCRRNGSIIL